MDTNRIPAEGRREKPRGRFPAVICLSALYVAVWLASAWLQAARPEAADSLEKLLSIETGRLDPRALLTYHFLHESWLHLLASLACIAFAGRLLEIRWGSLRFLLFFLAAALACGLSVHGIGEVLRASAAADRPPPEFLSYGATGAALACLAAYVLVAEDRTVVWILGERHLIWTGMILGALLLLYLERSSRSGATLLLTPQIAGIAVGAGLRLLALLPKQRLGPRSRDRRGRGEKAVHVRLRVDELLDKISRSGMESLSREEQAFLRQASKHFRNSR